MLAVCKDVPSGLQKLYFLFAFFRVYYNEGEQLCHNLEDVNAEDR
jgi:hypothetical protein